MTTQTEATALRATAGPRALAALLACLATLAIGAFALTGEAAALPHDGNGNVYNPLGDTADEGDDSDDDGGDSTTGGGSTGDTTGGPVGWGWRLCGHPIYPIG